MLERVCLYQLLSALAVVSCIPVHWIYPLYAHWYVFPVRKYPESCERHTWRTKGCQHPCAFPNLPIGTLCLDYEHRRRNPLGRLKLLNYEYNKEINGVEYTVVTEIDKRRDVFDDFYTKRTSPAARSTHSEEARDTANEVSVDKDNSDFPNSQAPNISEENSTRFRKSSNLKKSLVQNNNATMTSIYFNKPCLFILTN